VLKLPYSIVLKVEIGRVIEGKPIESRRLVEVDGANLMNMALELNA